MSLQINPDSRTKNSIKSMAATLIFYVANMLFGFLNRKVLIAIMGIEYQGVNGLFSSVLSILSITELGLGTAIIYHLYKPLAENNHEEIGSIMRFYRKCYIYIASMMLLIGGIISLNLNFFINDYNLPLNLHIIFFLMLADVVATYTFAYKRSILYADQKNYVVANINTIFIAVSNLAQILILYKTHDYYCFLGSRLFFRLIENFAINYVVDKRYPYLNAIKCKPLNKDILNDIKLKIKGLLFHKMSTFIAYGTDNILISKFLGLSIVGIYSNYYYVISSLNAILQQAFDSITGSVGHLIVTTEGEKKLDVFYQLNCVNALLSSIVINGTVTLSTLFVSLCFGNNLILDKSIVLVLGLNMIMTNQRRVFGMFKSAAGIQYEDRYVPMAESIINIAASIILLHYVGLIGIFLGTLISQICDFGYTFPKFVFSNTLNGSKSNYIRYLSFILLFHIISLVICYHICSIIKNQTWNGFVQRGLLCVIISIIVFLCFFYKSKALRGVIKRVTTNH